jgi:hypothetical protein
MAVRLFGIGWAWAWACFLGWLFLFTTYFDIPYPRRPQWQACFYRLRILSYWFILQYLTVTGGACRCTSITVPRTQFPVSHVTVRQYYLHCQWGSLRNSSKLCCLFMLPRRLTAGRHSIIKVRAPADWHSSLGPNDSRVGLCVSRSGSMI